MHALATTHVTLTQTPTPSFLAAYLGQVAKRTGSQRTPEEYRRIIERFISTVGVLDAVTPAHIHAFAYGAGVSRKEPSPSTVTVRLAAIRGFLDFARRMKAIGSNPADDVKRPTPRSITPKGLSAAELQRLLAAIPSTASGLRDRAIILTCVFTGLRRVEVMQFTVGGLTEDAGRVFYDIRAKGGIQRHRELPAPAVSAIQTMLEAEGRSLATMPKDARIFAVSHQGFYANLKRYAAKAKLEHVTPHTLRHSAAKLRRETGASIEDVASLLGHQNIATTARYLARLEGATDDGWHGVAAALDVA